MKVIIAGGVAAGMSAASKIKRMQPDAQVLVLERGGETSYGACGLPYYISGVNTQEDLLRIRKKEDFIKAGIDLRLFHQVIHANPEQKTVTIRNEQTKQEWDEEYDFLVIATGADSAIPPFKNRNLKHIFTLKTIEDANIIKQVVRQNPIKDVVIVGGGYIGLELTEAFLHLKCRVRIIEQANRLLTPFDAEISQKVADYLLKQGVSIHLSERVQGFEGEACVQKVITDLKRYDADLVILAAGLKPNTGFLKSTGIHMLDNGAILTNQYMETSITGIYAGGDCASVYHKILEKPVYLPLGTNANKQGRFIGENILGKKHAFQNAIGSSMIKIKDLELAKTGISEKEAIEHGFHYKTVTVTGKDHAPYYPDGKDILIKLIYESGTKRILGAQLMGSQGVALRMNVFAAAITAGMTTAELGETDLGYAPPYSMPWDIIHVACNAAK